MELISLKHQQKEILKLIVLEYIKLAKPVSSNLICDRLKCSSATIRSEMAALEELGLLEKTHTSSGRIPSEKGYRYYVDNLMQPKEMNAEDMNKLQIVFRNKQLALTDVISKSQGSRTSVNVVRATFDAVSKLMDARTVAQNRGKTLKDMWG